MRIISLVPSLTHAICDLGLKNQIVGCTTFCIDPPNLHRTAAIVGGTKDPDLAKIEELAPTHIVVNTEENKREHVDALRAMASVHETFPRTVADGPAMLRELGSFLGRSVEADSCAMAIETAMWACREGQSLDQSFLYFIWQDPYMVAGPDSYISRMLELIGLRNVAPAATSELDRYPTLDVNQIRDLQPDMLLLSSEPYPFRKRDYAKLQQQWPGLPDTCWIDGRLMSWYGTMQKEACQELLKWQRKEPTELIRAF